MRKKCVFSNEDVARIVELIKSHRTDAPNEGYIYQAAARVKWNVLLSALYSIPFATDLHFKDSNFHFGAGAATTSAVLAALKDLWVVAEVNNHTTTKYMTYETRKNKNKT